MLKARILSIYVFRLCQCMNSSLCWRVINISTFTQKSHGTNCYLINTIQRYHYIITLIENNLFLIVTRHLIHRLLVIPLLPKNALFHVLLKLIQQFWRERYFRFTLKSPLRGMNPYLTKFEFPLSKDALCPVWLKLAQ